MSIGALFLALKHTKGAPSDARVPLTEVATGQAARPGPAGPETVAAPKHQMHALTTYELRDYRRQLETAIAFFDRQDPVPPARRRLQARLDAVLTEQDDRRKLADARP